MIMVWSKMFQALSWFLLSVLLVLVHGAPTQGPCGTGRNKLLLVSFDGFQVNYLSPSLMPNLYKMRKEGVFTTYMGSPYPTTCNPSHFTLLTGRYVEDHGVVANSWFDVETKETKSFHDTQFVNEYWDNGSLPIWITAQRQGLKAGSYHFPGGAAAYGGEHVEHRVSVPAGSALGPEVANETLWREAVDTVVGKWLHERDVDLVTLYFGEPHATGHRYGPMSPEIKHMLEQVDRTVGYIQQVALERGLTERLNLIVTSDHGMNTVANDNTTEPFVLDNLPNVAPEDVQFSFLDSGGVALLQPVEGALERVYSALESSNRNVMVYRKDRMPLALHYAKHPRIPDIILMAEPFFSMQANADSSLRQGEHGHDYRHWEMHTLFLAQGPDFQYSYVSPFASVDVYPLMCHLLGITPQPHNGSLETFQEALAPCHTQGDSVVWKVLVGLFVVSVVLVVVIVLVRRHLNRTRGHSVVQSNEE